MLEMRGGCWVECERPGGRSGSPGLFLGLVVRSNSRAKLRVNRAASREHRFTSSASAPVRSQQCSTNQEYPWYGMHESGTAPPGVDPVAR